MANEVGVAYVALMPSMDKFNKAVRQAIKDNMGQFSSAVDNAGGDATSGLEKVAKKLADTGGKTGKDAGENMGLSFIGALKSALGGGANAVADKVIEMGRAAGQKFIEGFSATYGRVGSLMSSLATSQITDAGQALGLKLGNGIAGGLSTAKLAIGNAVGNVISSAIGMVTSSVSSAISRMDTMNNFPRAMANMGIGADEAKAAIERLSEATDGLPTKLNDAALGTQRLVAKNGDLKKSTDYFKALNDAILSGGAGAELQASAIEQLTQSYAKGQMDMMEWRTLQMAMPAQLNQVAKAMGMTAEQLGAGLRHAEKDAAYLRDIDMSEFMDMLVQLDETGADGFASFAKQARDASKTVGTAIVNMSSRIEKAQEVVLNWVGQENIFNAIESVTTKFKPFAEEVVAFLDRVNLKRYVGWVGTGLVDAFDRLHTAAAPAIATLEPLTKAAMSEGLEIISATLTHIVDEGTPFLDKLSGTLQDLLQGAPQISGTLQPVIDAFVDMKFDTWTAALDMWQKIAEAVLPVLPQIIDATGKVNTAVADIVGTLAGPAAQAFAKIYGIVADLIDKNAPLINIIGGQLAVILPKMAQQIADMVNAVAPFLPQVVGAFGSIVDTVGPAVTDIINKLAPHLPAIAETIASIANSLVPAVADMVAKAEPFIDPALELFKQAGTFVGDHLEGFLLLVGGIKAASAAVSGFSGLSKVIEDVTTIKGLIGGEGGLLSMITGSGAGEAISGAVAAVGGVGPALGIVGGIAAIAGALIYCWNTSEEFREGITGTLKSIQDAFGRLWEKVGPILEKIWDFLGTYIAPVLTTIAEVVGGIFLYAFQLAGEIIVGVLDTISLLLDGITSALDWLYHNLLEPVIGAFKDLFDWINKIEPPEWWNDFSGQFTNNTSVPSTRPFATGGIVTKPTRALIGEAGVPEAVVPLSAQGVQKFTSGLAPQYAAGGPSVEVHIDTFMNYDTDRDVRTLSEEIGRDTLRQLKMQGVYA